MNQDHSYSLPTSLSCFAALEHETMVPKMVRTTKKKHRIDDLSILR